MKGIAQSDKSYKNKCCIYQITQLSNSKKYIGSTRDAHTRRIDHYRDLVNNRHCNPHLQNSFNKYGEQDFVFHIVEETLFDNQFEREQWYLNNVVDWGNDFNSNRYAKLSSGTYGKKFSEKTKKKKSIALKGKRRIMSDEERERRSESAKIMNAKRKASGWKLSDDARKKRSEISKMLGLKPPICSQKGRNRTEETKTKISEASKRVWNARRENKNV